MEYSVDSVMALISHIHSAGADFTNSRLAQKGMVSSHGFILFQLAEKGTLSMSELSRLINRDKSTTTALVKKLEQQKLIKSEPSKQDSRKRDISLTAKGRRYQDFTQDISRQLLSACYQGFTPKDKATLLDLLTRLGQNLDAATQTN